MTVFLPGRILIPSVVNAFRNIFRRNIFCRYLRELRSCEALAEVFNYTVAANEEVLEETAIAGARVAFNRICTITKHAGLSHAAAINPAGFHISGTNGQQVRQIIIVYQRAAHVDGSVYDFQTCRIHRSIAVLQGNGAGHTAHHIMRMRILAAEDNMRRNQLALLIQHFQIMRHSQKMNFRRQQLVIGMVPPVGGENTQLAAFYDSFYLILNLFKILGRSCREVMLIGFRYGSFRRTERQFVSVQHRILQISRGNGVSSQSLYRAYPVQSMQMIEMHDMVLHRQRCRHDVADIIGILRNSNTQSVLNRTDRAQSMSRGANAANTLDISPGVTGVTILHNQFQAAPGGTGGNSVCNLPRCFINLHLYTKMTFNASYRIYYYMFHLFTCSLIPSLLRVSASAQRS